MNPREAEKLLGGYATGTLNDAERKALFAAALEDQALFDALADEEALRELLADPAAKARLLAALEAPPKTTPLWRRPGAMALAASLVAAVGVGVLLKQTKAPEMQQLQKAAPSMVEEAPPPKPAAPEANKQDKAQLDQPRTGAAPADMKPLEPEARRAMKRAPEPAPPPPPPPAAAAPAMAADATYAAPAQEARASKPEAKAVAGGTAAGLTATRQQVPAWTWEGSGSGRRLIVTWGPGGVLTLVTIRSTFNLKLSPLSEKRLPDGRTVSVFSVPEDAPPTELFWTQAPFPVSPMEPPPDGFHAFV
jgi:hypothetical protein